MGKSEGGGVCEKFMGSPTVCERPLFGFCCCLGFFKWQSPVLLIASISFSIVSDLPAFLS